MDFKTAIFLFFLPGMFIWIPLLFWYFLKKEMKEEEIQGNKNEAENRIKIEEEMEKPFYRIRFVTSDGNVNFSADITPAWDDRRIRSKNWFWLNTAEMEADKHLKFSYERGFFRDSNDNTYPACNVLTAKIEVVSGT